MMRLFRSKQPHNRKKQDVFICENCGHVDKADHNAAKIIKKRAINLRLDSGGVV